MALDQNEEVADHKISAGGQVRSQELERHLKGTLPVKPSPARGEHDQGKRKKCKKGVRGDGRCIHVDFGAEKVAKGGQGMTTCATDGDRRCGGRWSRWATPVGPCGAVLA